MGFEGEFLAVAGDESATELFFGDVADDFHVLDGGDAVVLGEGYGEEELVVFAAVEGTSRDVHVELFGSHSGLVVEWDAFFVDAAAHVALGTDVQHFRREAVADVHHGCRLDAGFAQGGDDVASGFRFELPFKQVFAAAEIGLCGCLVVSLVGEYGFFAF